MASYYQCELGAVFKPFVRKKILETEEKQITVFAVSTEQPEGLTKKQKVAGLLSGISAGWIMGLYQMMKGAHFISHTVVKMISAWILILVIHAVVNKLHPESNHTGLK